MNPQELAKARQRAQEARKRAVDLSDAAMLGLGAANCVDFFEDELPPILDAVDALAGEIEGLTRGLRGLAVEHEKLYRGVRDVLETWKRDQHPIMLEETMLLIAEVEAALSDGKERE